MIQHVKWALRHGLGGNELTVLLVLGAYADEEGFCYPGQELIGRETALSSRTVRTIIKRLEARGFVKITQRRRPDGYRSSNGYVLTMVSPAKISGEVSPETGSHRKQDDSLTGNPASGQEEPGKIQKIVNASATPKKDSRRLDEWNEFWKLYPRKVAKDAAFRAWVSALKRADPNVILIGLDRLLPSLTARDPQYVPYPATWLNAGSWDDEPDPVPIQPTERRGGPKPPREPIDPQREWEYR